jgi:hypothetical protein
MWQLMVLFSPHQQKLFHGQLTFFALFFFFRVLGKRASKTDSPWSTWFKEKKRSSAYFRFSKAGE